MYPISPAKIARKARALLACAGAVLVLTAGSALAGHGGGLHIDSASWDGSTLTADGGADKPKRGGGPVELFDVATSTSLGLANLQTSGSWSYSGNTCADNIYAIQDNVQTPPFPVSGQGCGGGSGFPNQTDFKILMNYELGMHCTGFEFAYCCVLPVYNSILAQVVKPAGATENEHPRLLEGDPNAGITSGNNPDVLGREIVLRDMELDGNGNFKKYVLRYWHDAQPRNDGRGKHQSTTLISNVEGNSLLAWNTVADAADLNPDGSFKLSGRDGNPLYNGARDVVLGNGAYDDVGGTFGVPIDNYQNVVWNHLYIYEVSAHGVEGAGGIPGGDRPEADKLRLGLHVDYPTNFGPAGHNMEGLLTYSGDAGTVVYTQMKVLEDLPIMLTSPRIWEALGLPLTPFEDTIDFFSNPGLVDEDSVRPYVAMKAQMYNYDPNAADGMGAAVLDSSGNEVIGFGTAPIDIPNCERCHSAPPEKAPGVPNVNSPNDNPADWALVQQEMNFWLAYYPSMQTGSDWYARLKGAAVSILARHDSEHGTGFLDNYPGVTCAKGLGDCDGGPLKVSRGNPGAGSAPFALAQNTRAGHESVICQKCHADNVIAVVKSASCGPGSITCADGDLIPPLTEAIHYNHRNVTEGGTIVFNDNEGRDGGCQGCHPAHRSDGDMSGYPITLDGDNFYAGLDNRDANGGCFVGRDVHSNPMKDVDGAETPAHLNPVGQWLADNVANDGKGIWCTNCHQQLGQEMWKAENVADLVNARPGDPGHVREPVAGHPNGGTLADVALAIGTTEAQAISWLDPKTTNPVDETHAIWAPDPGLCNYVAGYFGVIPVDPAHDGNVATVEVNVNSAAACSTGGGTGLIDCGVAYPGAPAFHICGSTDTDGDFNVSLLDFCTTPDCVTAAQATLPGGSVAVPVPFSAATDGRDHWLSPGEPHCADCHKAPYVEQSGNINAFPPFNYPRKASLMRYSRGHQDITCQGCHESIHGLYPVTPNIDTTSYAQAASLNHDGSHGPLKCGTCHRVGSDGIPIMKDGATDKPLKANIFGGSFDEVVTWMHTYTDEASPLGAVCKNCHGDNTSKIAETGGKWLRHGMKERITRKLMDKVEIELFGHVAGDPDAHNGNLPYEPGGADVCTACHTLSGGPTTGFETLVSCTDNAGAQCSAPSCSDAESSPNNCIGYNEGCNGTLWKRHLTEDRLAEKVWVAVSEANQGTGNTTCGW
ncbi:MAG: hypothetical protein OEY45_00430 [Gammaproteobacteria bacterium]|nr:hypothetical protein [Gammaproteobacteria bacterium]MDH5513608.1 hypothetical protein [Gammaproteobacteria bacterium]